MEKKKDRAILPREGYVENSVNSEFARSISEGAASPPRRSSGD